MKGLKVFFAVSVLVAGLESGAKADETTTAFYIGSYTKHYSDYYTEKVTTTTCYESKLNFFKALGRMNCSTEKSTIEVEYNKNTNLLAYQHGNYIVGYYKNSYNEDTAFVVRDFRLFSLSDFVFRAEAGINYGYRGCAMTQSQSKTVCPQIDFSVTYEKFKVQPVFTVQLNSTTISQKYVF